MITLTKGKVTDSELSPSMLEATTSHGSEPAVPSRWDNLFLGLLFIGAIAKLWLLPLRNGFWLDETGTAWAASGTLADVYKHTMAWPSQPLLYTLISWAAIQIGGMHEIILRLPSLLGLLIGAYTLYRLGARLLNREAAIIASLAFICTEAVYFAATDARPYALGTAGVIVSTYYLVQWLDRKSIRDALAYALALSFTIHMQYVFGTIVAVQLVYVGVRIWKGDRIPFGQILRFAVTFVLTLAIAFPQFQATLVTRKTHSFSGAPVLLDLWTLIAPPLVLGSLLIGLIFSSLLRRKLQFRISHPEFVTAVLIISWAVVPGALLFLGSSFSALGLFIPRYTLTAVPGVALLAGWIVSSMQSQPARRLTAAMIAGAAIFSSGGLFHPTHGGDWRRAIEVANNEIPNPQTPVLVRSGFIESAYLDYRDGAPHSDELFAPLLIYPLHGKLVKLSYAFRPSEGPYLRAISASLLTKSDRFVLVTSGDSSYESWLLGNLAEDDFNIQKTTRVGGVKDTLRVIVFTRE